MRRWVLLVLLVLLVAGTLIATGVVSVRVDVSGPRAGAQPFWTDKAAEGPLQDTLGIWIQVARTVKPAVVNVSTAQGARARGPLADDFFRRFFERPPTARPRTSLGSGLIAAADGYIVTNFHVIRDAAEIVVRLADQRELNAKLVGGDPRTDIALLKIEATRLPSLPFGDSDRLEVGAPVMAVGNPFGLDQSVTTGIVSAKERFIGSGPYDDFIQTDASVNPGNSGGPLVDTRGALVGINTAIFSQTGGSVGIGFAIPVNLAKQVLPQLRETGRVSRGYLGVAVAPVPSDVAESVRLSPRQGALVAEVVSRSPAAAAGLQPGDIILAFQGDPVESPQALTRRVGGTPPGTRVTLDIARAGGRRSVTTTLVELRDQAAEGR